MRRFLSGVHRALTIWRRSIQARVLVSIVVLSALIIGAVGWYVLLQTRHALLEKRRDAAIAEAASETAEAEQLLAAVPGTNYDPSLQIGELADTLIEHGRSRGYAVILAGPLTDDPTHEPGRRTSPGLDPGSVPDRLVQRISTDPVPVWTYGHMVQGGSAPVDSPAIVVAHRILLPADRGEYVVYFIFPLEQEGQTLGLVVRAVLAAGVLIVIGLGAVIWLVTRRVVTPIRHARRVAQRLAAGDLEERVSIPGEDDLSHLADSFNQMADTLQHKIVELEELSRLQRRFTSDVSHELRTPLTTVRMAGDLLYEARDGFDAASARAAELLETELDRFEALLADLLEISRFDAGAAALETEEVDLVEIVKHVVTLANGVAETRGVPITVEVVGSPDGMVLAQADPRRVERILRNLVNNAIDHADGTTVEVTVSGDHHAAAVAVRDHGVGLKDGDAQRVFNRFWRADPARARTTGGTGLGLSIALEDTRLHGGWLQAWGLPGQGAQFRLTLPRRSGVPLRHSPIPLVPSDPGIRS